MDQRSEMGKEKRKRKVSKAFLKSGDITNAEFDLVAQKVKQPVLGGVSDTRMNSCMN